MLLALHPLAAKMQTRYNMQVSILKPHSMLLLVSLLLAVDYPVWASILCRKFYSSTGMTVSNPSLSLLRYAYSVDVLRTDADRIDWYSYKNNDNKRPGQKISLDDPSLKDRWIMSQSVGVDLPSYPNLYERAVISLKRGDIVKFGTRSFKLGEFLGSGNASHVFELADQPHLVIKIPFIVSSLSRQTRVPKLSTVVNSGESHYDRIFEMLKLTTESLKKYRDDTIVDPSFRYFIMPRTQGQEATDFLSDVLIRARGRPLIIGEIIFYEQIQPVLSASELKLFSKLIQMGLQVGFTNKVGDDFALITSYLRQIMLSRSNEWEIIDAE